MAKTSLDWWNEVLTKPGKLDDWLRRQYHSEASSVPRIYKLLERAEKTNIGMALPEWQSLLSIIASDEQKHATQVQGLMYSRKLIPAILPEHKSKYFTKFQEGMSDDIWTWAAVAAYAELTSLTRFKAILQHPETPADIRWEFTSILFEEEFHYAAFRRLAGPRAMREAEVAHKRGLGAVGIE